MFGTTTTATTTGSNQLCKQNITLECVMIIIYLKCKNDECVWACVWVGVCYHKTPCLCIHSCCSPLLHSILLLHFFLLFFSKFRWSEKCGRRFSYVIQMLIERIARFHQRTHLKCVAFELESFEHILTQKITRKMFFSWFRQFSYCCCCRSRWLSVSQWVSVCVWFVFFSHSSPSPSPTAVIIIINSSQLVCVSLFCCCCRSFGCRGRCRRRRYI